jgi:phage terminase Nu1 subunit (DNA packaging protein)
MGRERTRPGQSTAGEIRALVDKLPPEEKRKAKEVVAQLTDALGEQGKLVTESVQRADESTRLIREYAQTVRRGSPTSNRACWG